ncbi:phage tail sheath C-terminal domain-containing protein [Faucicola boevrei]|uniref:phage tail sheath C-terminal domain-containing protein n=1 Tax=Faucicola boevrei TaxID=346665 RepID=UPI00037DF89B|nr:phage tail sheath C-terminal domain-containing protein [Moraxella boevrei]
MKNLKTQTSAIACAVALRALIDDTYPASFTKSISNVPIPTASGIVHPRTWSLTDPNTEVGYLNANEVTSLIQHEGFRFWGNRTTSSEPRFAFETVVRSAQFLKRTIADGCFPFIDKPLTPILARDIIDSINAKVRALVSKGLFIGANCWYDEAENNPQDLSQGILYIDYEYTPVPTLENLHLNQRITDRYLVDFSKLIAQSA